MNEVEIGKLGEHICCVRLMKLGFNAEIINLSKTDVIVDSFEAYKLNNKGCLASRWFDLENRDTLV